MTTQQKLDNEFGKMILSASGWRKIFASSGDGEDHTKHISQEDILICTAASLTFCDVLNLADGKPVLLAMDGRPTGKEICSVIGKVMLHKGASVKFAGICSAPQAMAESAVRPYECFVYVSASHNPVGHNGIKIGANGGAFGKDVMKVLINAMKDNMKDADKLKSYYLASQKETILEDASINKQSLDDYRMFVEKTTCPDGSFADFAKLVKKANLGVVADFNGSARCVSIDKNFLSDIGVKTCFINDKIGDIVHGIVPEGKNLQPCCEFLEKKHKEDPSFVLGYVPDNDGDRGNLVYVNSKGKANILKAQEVFALCVDATLGYHNLIGSKNLAVAVNCATSMRIADIAAKYNAKVFTAEVGESNVVGLAESLRKQGFEVPILGEGANGGNITYPARVRDPMNTLMCMFRLICSGSTIEKALENLPVYTTTDAYESEGVLHLKTQDYLTLRKIYEKNFPSQWECFKTCLAEYSIASYLEFQTEGIYERQETGGASTGGLKMVFYDKDKNRVAFIWFRPSMTEPLLRVLTDVKGNKKELHDKLNNWNRDMILKAQEEMLG